MGLPPEDCGLNPGRDQYRGYQRSTARQHSPRARRWTGAHRNHLHMTLLELSLNAIKVGSIEVVFVVGVLNDVVVNSTLLQGAALVSLFIVVL